MADQVVVAPSGLYCESGCFIVNADPASAGVSPQRLTCYFQDPLPANATVTQISVTRQMGKAYYYSWASTPTVGMDINGQTIGSALDVPTYATCGGLAGITFDSGPFPDGFESYVYGGANEVGLTVSNGALNVGDTSITITYVNVPRLLQASAGTPVIDGGAGLVNKCQSYFSKVTVTASFGSKLVGGASAVLGSTRNSVFSEPDMLVNPSPTNTKGVADDGLFQTRLQGSAGVTASAKGFRSGPASSLTLGEADYADQFIVTSYITALESDFNGQQVTNPCGLTGTWNKAFLFSNRGIIMEGSGRDLAGNIIVIDWSKPHWCFKYDTCPHTAAGTCATANRTVAVDRNWIALKSNLSVDGIGLRTAEDTGGAIVGAHIDNFVGEGKAAAKAGGTHHNVKVRYLSGGGVCGN